MVQVTETTSGVDETVDGIERLWLMFLESPVGPKFWTAVALVALIVVCVTAVKVAKARR